MSLPNAIRAGLDGLRRKLRLSLGVRGLSSAALAAVAILLVDFALDRTLRLSWEARAVTLLLILTALAAVLWSRLVRPLRVPLGDVELARLVEGAVPSLEWRLLSAVQFSDPGWTPGPHTSRSLADQVVADAAQLAPSVPFGRPVPTAPVVKRGFQGAVVLAAGLGLAVGFPAVAKVWFARNVLLSSTAKWPQDTFLSLEVRWEQGTFTAAHPKDGGVPVPSAERLRVARGASLALHVLAEGVIPTRVYLDSVAADGTPERWVLDQVGEEEVDGRRFARYRTTLDQLAESFRFSVTTGRSDETLGPFEVEVLRRPWIEGLELRATPPAYTGLEPRSFGLEAGSVALPVGTEVEVRATTSKALALAWVSEERASLDPNVASIASIHTGQFLDGSEARRFAARFTLGESASYSVQVEDTDGLGFGEDTRFTLVAQPDEAPEATLELRGVGQTVSPQVSLRYRSTLSDDHGLTRARLRLIAAGRRDGEGKPLEAEPAEQAIEVPAGLASTDASGAYPVSELKLVPSMTLDVWAEVADNRPGEAQLGSSPTFQLRVVSSEELLNDLLRRLHEQRLALERVVSEEERLALGLKGLDATVLERASRSHRDVSRVVIRAAEVVEGVVEELTSNALLDEAAWERLRNDVSLALRQVDATTIKQARALAEQTAAAPGGPERAKLGIKAGERAADVATELGQILVRLGRVEDLAQLISQLKKIIREQEDALQESRKD
ncbi:MAG: hypothetical protein KDD82_05545 [Planctomycetes bacterium]|nr:hypothetical protein [Planctomycetota bacterium]